MNKEKSTHAVAEFEGYVYPNDGGAPVPAVRVLDRDALLVGMKLYASSDADYARVLHLTHERDVARKAVAASAERIASNPAAPDLPRWIDDRKGRDPETDALIEYIEKLRAALAAAAPKAQAEPRPTDDELWDQTLRERDHAQEMADTLAEAIGKYFDAEIGEHSNQNCPWHEALDVIESWQAQAAPAAPIITTTSLTDLRDYFGHVINTRETLTLSPESASTLFDAMTTPPAAPSQDTASKTHSAPD